MNEKTVRQKTWLPLAISMSIAVVVYVVLTHFSAIWTGVQSIAGFFSPVFLAAVIAYLVNPLANWYQKNLFRRMKKEKYRSVASNVLAFVTVIALFALLLIILIPQLVDGAASFLANMDVYMEKAKSSLPNWKLSRVMTTKPSAIPKTGCIIPPKRSGILNSLFRSFLREYQNHAY